LRGIDFQKLKKYNLAIKDYTKTILLEPINADAYYFRGKCNLGLKKHQIALADFDLAIHYRINHHKAYFEKATIYCQLKNYQKALYNYDKAIENDDDDSAIYYQKRGILKIKLGQKVEGNLDLKKHKEILLKNKSKTF
jgi:tetratricopeptide (TPR) repeat protein